MSACNLMSKCLYVSSTMETVPATAKLINGMYCNGNPTLCARYKAAHAVGLDTIPEDLSPSDDDLAERIVSEHNSQVMIQP